MNALRVYNSLWLEYPLDYIRLELNAREMTYYARELGEVDPDGFTRVWVHTFEGLFGTLDWKDPTHSRLQDKIENDVNTFQAKSTLGKYYVCKHDESDVYGLMYSERER